MQNVLDVDRPAADEIIVTQSAGNDDDFVFHQQVPELLKRLAEEAHFHARGVVIEHHADPIATLPDIHDQPRDGRLALRLCVFAFTFIGLRRRFRRDVTQLAISKIARIMAHSIKRVPGQIQAKRFLSRYSGDSLLPFRQLRRFVLSDFGDLPPVRTYRFAPLPWLWLPGPRCATPPEPGASCCDASRRSRPLRRT